ncbi:MAG: hypothetical protein QM811_21730 [Pirellulales bacterium]
MLAAAVPTGACSPAADGRTIGLPLFAAATLTGTRAAAWKRSFPVSSWKRSLTTATGDGAFPITTGAIPAAGKRTLSVSAGEWSFATAAGDRTFPITAGTCSTTGERPFAVATGTIASGSEVAAWTRAAPGSKISAGAIAAAEITDARLRRRRVLGIFGRLPPPTPPKMSAPPGVAGRVVGNDGRWAGRTLLPKLDDEGSPPNDGRELGVDGREVGMFGR